VIPQSLDDDDDPGGQTIRGIRFVQSDVRVYFPQPCARQRRPDNL
jgi:hypothetical protein